VINLTVQRASLSDEFLLAAQAVRAVLDGAKLPMALEHAAILARRRHALPAESLAAATDIAYGTVRQLGLYKALLRQLASRAPKIEVSSLIWVALDQLIRARRAPAIVVDQAVTAVKVSDVGSASLVNACLRRFGREQEALLASVQSDVEARYGLPQWWAQLIRTQYPHDWRAVAAAAQDPPPMTLRVATDRLTADAYVAQLEAVGIEAMAISPQSVVLAHPLSVHSLPGFSVGDVSVQDRGAQLAAELLDVADGQRVLDACAAPGGKTVHLLELAKLDVIALDDDSRRMQRVQENLSRSGRSAELVVADAAAAASWWDGIAFDRILLDAPCSASGVLRRHPEIRWLRSRGELATQSVVQRQLLEALWPTLKPGGKLLYVTCSIFAEENEAVLEPFMHAHEDCQALELGTPQTAAAVELDERLAIGIRYLRRTVGVQLLPNSEGVPHDGFYYALLAKSLSAQS
jgi:16S rRNA (cytosine967-C5)-methyltransferase